VKKTITVSTHDGFFHADDVFALAVVNLWAKGGGKQISIIRSRKKEIFEKAELVVDIGGVYEPETNHFDHHQQGGAGKRPNGIPYAAFGLMWKHFGEKITSKEAAALVEKKLVMPIDAIDNGVNLSTPLITGISDYTIANAIWTLGEFDEGGGNDESFRRAVDIASQILSGEIKKAEATVEGERVVEAEIMAQGEPAVLVLSTYYPWSRTVSRYEKIMFVIFPDKGTSKWCIQAASDGDSFGNDRISFPTEWRGLTDEALADKSGISTAVFCHRAGFFAVAKSRVGAEEMAHKVIGDRIGVYDK
jgi:uncharacterized UPF0160 family protein